MNVPTTLTPADALAMLEECFALPSGSLQPDMLREAIDEWDSMGALMLMAELDERFGIELTAEVSREMQRVDDVLQFLRQHGVLRDEAA